MASKKSKKKDDKKKKTKSKASKKPKQVRKERPTLELTLFQLSHLRELMTVSLNNTESSISEILADTHQKQNGNEVQEEDDLYDEIIRLCEKFGLVGFDAENDVTIDLSFEVKRKSEEKNKTSNEDDDPQTDDEDDSGLSWNGWALDDDEEDDDC